MESGGAAGAQGEQDQLVRAYHRRIRRGQDHACSLIHNNSSRSSRPFVVINCGAIPEQLLESELFGYEKGAFTGASAHGKMGLIETADKGMLFLDEIGELQYSLQSKLLEVFEKKSFIRVGGTKRTSVDIRILAATNKNLPRRWKRGISGGICFTGSTSFLSSFRPCANGRKTCGP